jgi:hypothetical protein
VMTSNAFPMFWSSFSHCTDKVLPWLSLPKSPAVNHAFNFLNNSQLGRDMILLSAEVTRTVNAKWIEIRFQPMQWSRGQSVQNRWWPLSVQWGSRTLIWMCAGGSSDPARSLTEIHQWLCFPWVHFVMEENEDLRDGMLDLFRDPNLDREKWVLSKQLRLCRNDPLISKYGF